LRRFNPTDESRTVTLILDLDNTRSRGFSQRLRAIRRAVVGDQNFTDDAAISQIASRLLDTRFDGQCLVEAGQ
jgi:hypothetical protein